jgi:3-hydroxy-9,10-secoandrosta-1,3,5(10)-triene-9,17-dione monooxygenase reductase component
VAPIDLPGEEPEPTTIDGARFRQVLGRFATGVTVVTGMAGGEPVGLAVNSFTSVSLEPALVAFCVATASRTWPRLRSAGTFCVNILAEDQEALSRAFAGRPPDRFLGVGWRPGPSGAPILAGGLAWIDCRVDAEHDAGDHVIVVGRVRELDVGHEGRPLVFYRGGYGRFEP